MISQVLPDITSLPPSRRTGYLWRLTDKRLVASSWKCRFYVLSGDQLYFFSSSQHTAVGVINLRQVTACVEAPVSEQRKANNVFILTSDQKHVLDGNKCYLSAETLSEMRAWILDIRAVLNMNNKATTLQTSEMKQNKLINTDQSVASNNSHLVHHSHDSSHQYLNHGQSNTFVNKDTSTDLDYHNLTYSYSSDDDDDDEVFSFSSPSSPRTQRSPAMSRSPRTIRSAESSLLRRTLKKNFKTSYQHRSEQSDHYQRLSSMLSDLDHQSQHLENKISNIELETREDCDNSEADKQMLKHKMESVNRIMLGLECETSQLLKVENLC